MIDEIIRPRIKRGNIPGTAKTVDIDGIGDLDATVDDLLRIVEDPREFGSVDRVHDCREGWATLEPLQDRTFRLSENEQGYERLWFCCEHVGGDHVILVVTRGILRSSGCGYCKPFDCFAP